MSGLTGSDTQRNTPSLTGFATDETGFCKTSSSAAIGHDVPVRRRYFFPIVIPPQTKPWTLFPSSTSSESIITDVNPSSHAFTTHGASE